MVTAVSSLVEFISYFSKMIDLFFFTTTKAAEASSINDNINNNDNNANKTRHWAERLSLDSLITYKVSQSRRLEGQNELKTK